MPPGALGASLKGQHSGTDRQSSFPQSMSQDDCRASSSSGVSTPGKGEKPFHCLAGADSSRSKASNRAIPAGDSIAFSIFARQPFSLATLECPFASHRAMLASGIASRRGSRSSLSAMARNASDDCSSAAWKMAAEGRGSAVAMEFKRRRRAVLEHNGPTSLMQIPRVAFLARQCDGPSPVWPFMNHMAEPQGHHLPPVAGASLPPGDRFTNGDQHL